MEDVLLTPCSPLVGICVIGAYLSQICIGYPFGENDGFDDLKRMMKKFK